MSRSLFDEEPTMENFCVSYLKFMALSERRLEHIRLAF